MTDLDTTSLARDTKPGPARKREEAPGDFSEGLVALRYPASVAAEAYRTLRTNLFYALVDDPPRVIAVTSPGPREGKSMTCANLGVVLAQAEKRTLILDCDLRRPTMHGIFGLRNFRGLVDVVAGGMEPRKAWREPLYGLKVMTAGPIPPNPAELLGSRRFAEFLSGVREEFDYVLLDAPPTELVSDPVILATQADGVLLVVNAQSTRKGSVRSSIRSLEAVEAKVLGTVMNSVRSSRNGYYGHAGYTYE